jgi:hypothetical protein
VVALDGAEHDAVQVWMDMVAALEAVAAGCGTNAITAVQRPDGVLEAGCWTRRMSKRSRQAVNGKLCRAVGDREAWAIPFITAVRNAGGELVDQARVPSDAAAAAREDAAFAGGQ